MKMKNILPILCIMLFAMNAVAQTAASEIKVEVKTESVSVEYKPLTKLFANTNNTIRIKADGYPILKAEIDNGNIVSAEGDIFVINPTYPGKLTMKIIDGRDDVNLKLLATNTYEVVAFGEMKISVAGKTGSNISITVEEFLSDSIIHVLPEELKAEVTAYKMSFSGKDVKYTELGAIGNKISETMRAIIKTLKPGDIVFIEFIKAKINIGSDGSMRPLAPVQVTIIAK
jgi:hypothetical protein